MKILILGGTGTISSEIVRQALAAGHSLTLVNRGNRPSAYQDQVTSVVADRSDKAAFAEAMKPLQADVVIDMICFNEENARQTVELFADRVQQIIVTSSIAAYNRPYHSFPIREEAETLRTSPDFGYGFHKAEAERYLQSQMNHHQAAITIIRPSFTFGAGTANLGILRQNRNLVRRIQEGKPVVMVGEGGIPWTFTFARDLASAYVLSAGNEKTYNDAFHVTNTELVMWEDLYKAIGSALGKEVEMCYISSVLLREFYPEVCAHLNFEKVHFNYYSIEKFRRAVPEYHPVVGLQEGIREVMDWWEATGFPYDEEKDKLEDQICGLYKQFEKDLLALRP